MEFGKSLVRVRGWVQRFIKNCRKSKEDRIFGQLTPEDLKQVEEEIIKEAQIEAYRQEFDALTNRTALPKQSSILIESYPNPEKRTDAFKYVASLF